jgi:hypothetical protein
MSARAFVTGALSIASGAAMIAAPRSIGRLYALPPSSPLVRGLGVRDVVLGLAMLLTPRKRSLFLARAASDAFDVALMTAEVASGRRRHRANAAQIGYRLLLIAV